jgi:hypothetical protein
VNPLTGKPDSSPGQKTKEQELADAEANVKRLKDELNSNPDAGKERFRKWARRGVVSGAITAIIIVGIYVKALAMLIASNGAEINFNTIKTKPVTALGFTVPFVTPDEVNVTWTARKVGSPGGILSAVRTPPGCSIEFHDSDLPEVEKYNDTSQKGAIPTEIKDPAKEFSVDVGDDSRDIDKKNKGWGKIHTTFEQCVDQAARDTGHFFASAFPGLPNGLPDASSIINGILAIGLIIAIVAIMGPIIIGLFTKITPEPTSST